MLATQKGRSKPSRISFHRCARLKGLSVKPEDDYSPRLLRNCSAVRPLTRMTFLRLDCPAAIVTEERDTFKSFAKKATQASLARPLTGGVVSESLSASPTSPVMASFFARGCTLVAN